MSSVDEKRHVNDSALRGAPSRLRDKGVIEARAVSRLQNSSYPEVRRIGCDFHDGMLRLWGRVPSYYLKQVAQCAVLGMDDVDEIHNQLEVVAPPDCP